MSLLLVFTIFSFLLSHVSSDFAITNFVTARSLIQTWGAAQLLNSGLKLTKILIERLERSHSSLSVSYVFRAGLLTWRCWKMILEPMMDKLELFGYLNLTPSSLFIECVFYRYGLNNNKQFLLSGFDTRFSVLIPTILPVSHLRFCCVAHELIHFFPLLSFV